MKARLTCMQEGTMPQSLTRCLRTLPITQLHAAIYNAVVIQPGVTYTYAVALQAGNADAATCLCAHQINRVLLKFAKMPYWRF